MVPVTFMEISIHLAYIAMTTGNISLPLLLILLLVVVVVVVVECVSRGHPVVSGRRARPSHSQPSSPPPFLSFVLCLIKCVCAWLPS